MTTLSIERAPGDETASMRVPGRLCLWAGALGVASGVFLAVVPPAVVEDRYSYPLTAVGFVLIQCWFVVQHLGLLAGIVGLGRIGTATALRAKSLGMDVVFYDPYVADGRDKSIGVRRVETLDELLAEAHVVSPHCPLTKETYHLIDAAALPDHLRCRYVVRERVGREVGDVYAATTLVVGRAGAGTVNELSALGLPALLIPLPGAEEQRQNALVLVDAGSAEMLDQGNLTPQALVERVCGILRDRVRLEAMKANGRVIDPGAPARLLVDELIELALERGYPSAS